VHSFEGDVQLDGFDEPFHGVFIRAPWVSDHGDDVRVLGAVDGHPVAVAAGRVLAVSFHPELTGEERLHRRLLELIADARPASGGGEV
jgi:5'-phosphate synthase pdxT subunit